MSHVALHHVKMDADDEPLEDGWHGTRLVKLQRVAPGAVRVVDNALPAELADAVYRYTLELGRSWGEYVTLAEAAEEKTGDANSHSLAKQLVRSVWLNGQAASELLAPEVHRVHGFALWANIGALGQECAYHLDYAELHRRRTSRLHTPLLASTVHVSDMDAESGEIAGGVFGVNTGGLRHYLRFGHHCVLARGTPGALDKDWDSDPHWVKVRHSPHHTRGPDAPDRLAKFHAIHTPGQLPLPPSRPVRWDAAASGDGDFCDA